MAKRPRVEPSDATPADLTTPSSFDPSSSSRAAVSLADIMERLQYMRADFGSHLDLLSNEMCQMNTKIGRIAHCQSRLGCFAPPPSPGHDEESSSLNGGDEDGDDASGFENDDEMTTSQ